VNIIKLLNAHVHIAAQGMANAVNVLPIMQRARNFLHVFFLKKQSVPMTGASAHW
jgi:hypothetical protein